MKTFLITILLLITTIFSSSYADIRRGDGADVPAGTLINFSGPSCPSGFLSTVNGLAVSRTTYSKLFAAIGTTYGVGDGLTTFNLPNSSWFIDVNIGGENPSLGVGVQTAYTHISNASLQMTINSTNQSATAKIPCQSGVFPSGLNCGAAVEVVGIAFTPPKANEQYEVCTSISTTIQESKGLTYQLMETPGNAVTVLQNGRVRPYLQGNNMVVPLRLCSIFYFSNIAEKTIRLMYTKEASISDFVIIGDQEVLYGGRDISFSVKPVKPIESCIKY